MRYFLRLSYLGSAYHGWQRQKNAISVQEVLESAVQKLLGNPTEITGCGRTDTGVHATEFYAHFDTEESILEEEKFIYNLNGILPLDIAVNDLIRVEETAHTRFDAVSRSYEYHIHQQKSPFINGKSYFFAPHLNVNDMNEAAACLFNYNEFGAFCKAGSDNKTNLCDVTRAEWKVHSDRLIFHITADRFLRNMVRAITGTLLSVGQGKMTVSDFKTIIESQDRTQAGFSAPAQGLYLTKVKYPYLNE